MKLICIRACIMDDGEKSTTVGKVYPVERIEGEKYLIVDDAGDNHYFTKIKKYFEIIEDEGGKEKMEFKVGDIVKPKKKASNEYTITTKEMNFKGVVVEIRDDVIVLTNYDNSKEEVYPVASKYFKLLHRPEFKVGDELEIIDNNSNHCFDEGDIVTVNEVCYNDFEDRLVNYEVSDDFYNYSHLIEDDVEMWESELEDVVSKYRIGDIVEIKNEEFGHQFKDGDKVEIIDTILGSALTFKEEWYYEAKSVETGKKWFICDAEIQGLASKFKVGDRVKALPSSNGVYSITCENEGYVGEVTSVITTSQYHDIIVSHKGTEFKVESKYFELFDPKSETIEIQIGDTKVIFSDRYTIAIRNGKKAVSKCHPDDKYDARIGLKVAIEKLDSKVKELKVGSKVRIVSGYKDFHYYPVGTIVEVTAIGDNGVVCTKGKSSFGYNIIQTLYPERYEVI